ncbi:MAG: SUMF1/EgtB/PvdO family nonheme iron enzyme [Deltaproteobacteria bacterium]|nr:SUMF1/EgtB/PvdO family nonheme iron enzyme [Deltaproteobacteria bacterium]
MSAAEHDLVAVPATTGAVGLAASQVEALVLSNSTLATAQALADGNPGGRPGADAGLADGARAGAIAQAAPERVRIALRTLIPRRPLTLRGFQIDRTRVTNRMYARFLRDSGHGAPSSWPNGRMPPGREGCPVTHVSHKDAFSYATWADLELASEAEWEIAAGGADGRRYPWGDDARPELEILRKADPAALAADAYPALASPFGVLGLVWPSWEWCADAFAPLPGGEPAAFEAAYPEHQQSHRALRGGHSHWQQYGVWARIGAEPSTTRFDHGFRCVRRGL